MTSIDPSHGGHPTLSHSRAAIKILIIITGLLCLAGLLALTLDQPALAQLKFDLSLWSLIAVVLIINIVCFAIFVALFFAYQWVRSDLKSPRIEDEKD